MRLYRVTARATLFAALLAPVGVVGAQDGTTRERRANPTQAPARTTTGTSPAPQRHDIPPDVDPIQLSTDVVNVLFTVTDDKSAGLTVTDDKSALTPADKSA